MLGRSALSLTAASSTGSARWSRPVVYASTASQRSSFIVRDLSPVAPEPIEAAPPRPPRMASAAPTRASRRDSGWSRRRQVATRSGPRYRIPSVEADGSSRRDSNGTPRLPRRAIRIDACRSSRAGASVPAGPSASESVIVSTSSAALPRKISCPSGRSSRAASGIHRYGSHQIAAPYSLIARSKLASASGTASALAWISGKCRSCSSWSARAVASWFSESRCRPAERLVGQARHDTYAVPHPSSMTSRPLTSGRRCTSVSGMPQMPHDGCCAQLRRPGSAYSAADWFQAARLRAT